MSRKDDLERAIRESYEIIGGYEDTIRTSRRPDEKAEARRIIQEQHTLIKEYRSELRALKERRPIWIWVVSSVLVLAVLGGGSFLGIRAALRSRTSPTDTPVIKSIEALTSTPAPTSIVVPTLTHTSAPTASFTKALQPTATSTATPTAAVSTVTHDIVLLVDGSRSMNDDELMKNVIRPFVQNAFYEVQRAWRGDRLSVAMFDDGANIIHPLTDDHSVADTDLEGVRGGGGNQIALGLDKVRDELKKNARPEAQRVVIVVSDGFHPYDPEDDDPYNPSSPDSIAEAASDIKSDGIVVFLVAIPIERITEEDQHLLKQIASDNRHFFAASTSQDLLDSLISILNQSRFGSGACTTQSQDGTHIVAWDPACWIIESDPSDSFGYQFEGNGVYITAESSRGGAFYAGSLGIRTHPSVPCLYFDLIEFDMMLEEAEGEMYTQFEAGWNNGEGLSDILVGLTLNSDHSIACLVWNPRVGNPNLTQERSEKIEDQGYHTVRLGWADEQVTVSIDGETRFIDLSIDPNGYPGWFAFKAFHLSGGRMRSRIKSLRIRCR